MARLKDVLTYKKEFIYVGTFVFIIILVEVLIFNQGFVFSNLLRLEERHYSINDGTLYQFNLENGNLVAQNNDPNITFENINIPVGYISIKCNNSIPGAIGQVFYRKNEESFNEPHSIHYDASLRDKTFILNSNFGLPKVQTVSSLRFDLTDTPHDIITCSDFVINPHHIPLQLNLTRLAIYIGLLLLSIFFIFGNIGPIKNVRYKIFSGLNKITDYIKRNVNDPLDIKIGFIASDFSKYLKENAYVIITLAVIAIAAYGFELFNLNITLDEEIFAFKSAPLEWMVQGRWGMYLLNKYLLPYVVVPFVPLFLALVFHIGAVLLMLNGWGVKSKPEQIIIGAIGITFPGMAYLYTFSTLNYGIGVGLFCVALSLFMYSKKTGPQKYLAVIPAVFAISIYQGFILALVFVFLIYLIYIGIRAGEHILKHVIRISLIQILSILAYLIIQKVLFIINKVTLSGYIFKQFEFENLRNNFGYIFLRFWDMLFKVYFGDKSIYSYKIESLGILLVLALLGLAASLLRSKSSTATKALVILFALGVLLLPFSSGFLMNGYYEMRFLVGLPIVLSGLIMLGIVDNPRIYKILVGLLAVFCVLQFVRSDNHLFASSYLALQADRWTGFRLIERIEVAKAEAEPPGEIELKYMEIVGILRPPETELMPKLSTFGLSFFEWDQGNAERVLLFLKTLGYQGLQPLPSERRSKMIELAKMMPNWPEGGSVKVIGDTVLVKFGPYSNQQINFICGAVQKQGGDIFDFNSCVSKLFTQ